AAAATRKTAIFSPALLESAASSPVAAKSPQMRAGARAVPGPSSQGDSSNRRRARSPAAASSSTSTRLGERRVSSRACPEQAVGEGEGRRYVQRGDAQDRRRQHAEQTLQRGHGARGVQRAGCLPLGIDRLVEGLALAD